MKSQQLDFKVKTHFLNLYAMALSDTSIDTMELDLLYRIGEEKGVSKEEIQKLLLHPNEVNFTIPYDVLEKIEYLYDFARLIWLTTRLIRKKYLH